MLLGAALTYGLCCLRSAKPKQAWLCSCLGAAFFILHSSFFISCGSDDDEPMAEGYTVATIGEAPSWQINWEGDDPRPDWQRPVPASYENWSVLLVQIEDELRPYVSDDDLLALFVDDELRGLASPAVSVGGEDEDDKGLFVMKAYGNESDRNQVSVTLSYYNSRLRQLFSRSVQMKYDMGKVYGGDDDLVPDFTMGASKYPVVKEIGVSRFKNQISGVTTPAAADVMAVFVNDECRGRYTLGAALLESADAMLVFAKNTGETFTLRYYQPATGKVYSFKEPVKI